MSSVIVIPQQIVDYARESLCRQLGYAAEEIAQISTGGGYEHTELYDKPLAQVDRFRALLDLIGWEGTQSTSVTVARPQDRHTLIQALKAQLRIERDMSNEDPALKHAEQQIATATCRARNIELFLRETAPAPNATP